MYSFLPSLHLISLSLPLSLFLSPLFLPALALTTAPNTLNPGGSHLSFSTSSFNIQLSNSSQTLASLVPSSLADTSFNFAATRVLANRSADGQYHTGDLTFRLRDATTVGRGGEWQTFDTAIHRAPVSALATSENEISVANLGPTLSGSDGIVQVTRTWSTLPSTENSTSAGAVQLRFNITNVSPNTLEFGALGIPIEINNVLTDLTAEEMYADCVFADPSISSSGGYVRVTRLSGASPAMVITPIEGTDTPLEAWNFLAERDTGSWPFYQSQTFEANYEWMVYTAAYVENEWANAAPWNPASSTTIEPGDTLSVGLQFNLVDEGVRGVEDVLTELGRPVVVGIPGYVLPEDTVGSLFVKSGAAGAVQTISVTPSGSLDVSLSASQPSEWAAYTLTPSPNTWGRVRVALAYADGSEHTVQYYITKSAPAALADLGSFLFNEQWFTNLSDPFGRAPSVISYDRIANTQVLQDPRVWIPGLSDEGGAGSWLAAAQKIYLQPSAAEVAKFEEFMTTTVWGGLQLANGSNMFGVRAHVFFYEPDAVPGYVYDPNIDWSNWWSYDKAHSLTVVRAYNYVHVIAAYWALYRLARTYPALITQQTAGWYLTQAANTVLKLTASPHINNWGDGLMGETVFYYLLQDLRREGGNRTLAQQVEDRMLERANVWKNAAVPFGSELAWDSTGQEGVYLWSSFFGNNGTAQNALNSVLGYTPAVPHWGWNGNARRYWDNVYAGKLMRVERQIHHYGSSLNSLVLLSNFRTTASASSSDFYALRVGHAGISAPLTNIDQDGFAAASFHSFPETLAWDGYSGDYGPAFSGMALGAGTYVLKHAEFGWVAFGAKEASLASNAGGVNNASAENGLRMVGTTKMRGSSRGRRWDKRQAAGGETVTVQPADATRRRLFVVPLGLYVELDAGAIASATIAMTSDSEGNVQLDIVPRVEQFGEAAAATEVRVTTPALGEGQTGGWTVSGDRVTAGGTTGSWSVTIPSGGVTVTIEEA